MLRSQLFFVQGYTKRSFTKCTKDLKKHTSCARSQVSTSQLWNKKIWLLIQAPPPESKTLQSFHLELCLCSVTPLPFREAGGKALKLGEQHPHRYPLPTCILSNYPQNLAPVLKKVLQPLWIILFKLTLTAFYSSSRCGDEKKALRTLHHLKNAHPSVKRGLVWGEGDGETLPSRLLVF